MIDNDRCVSITDLIIGIVLIYLVAIFDDWMIDSESNVEYKNECVSNMKD